MLKQHDYILRILNLGHFLIYIVMILCCGGFINNFYKLVYYSKITLPTFILMSIFKILIIVMLLQLLKILKRFKNRDIFNIANVKNFKNISFILLTFAIASCFIDTGETSHFIKIFLLDIKESSVMFTILGIMSYLLSYAFYDAYLTKENEKKLKEENDLTI